MNEQKHNRTRRRQAAKINSVVVAMSFTPRLLIDDFILGMIDGAVVDLAGFVVPKINQLRIYSNFFRVN